MSTIMLVAGILLSIAAVLCLVVCIIAWTKMRGIPASTINTANRTEIKK
jgi:hypothetical protein